jgi:thiol-disulfide isomerase/thioredoxin
MKHQSFRNGLTLFLITLSLLGNYYLATVQAQPPKKQPSPTGGYRIEAEIKPYQNGKLFLAYHYGESKGLADSAEINTNSKAVFAGSQKLHPGIYMVVSPAKMILFELLIDEDQHFSIFADTTNLRSIRFEGSQDNDQFLQYQKFTDEKGKLITELQSQLKDPALAEKDKNQIQLNINRQAKSIEEFRAAYLAAHPNTMLASLFKALQDPLIPPAAEHPGGKYDTAFAFQFYKSNYWKNVDLQSDRLVRTPFFKGKLNRYLKNIVSPEADSLILETDQLLQQAKPAPEMFKFLLSHFIDLYINPEIMGQDKVFIYLFEKYINPGEAPWLSEKQKKFIFDRAYNLMANQIGAQAAPLLLVDTAGKPAPLHKIQAPFTVLVFWDPTCGHCKEVVPKIDSLFQQKWKKEGVVVYGVMVDGGLPAWKKYIQENNLSGWIHAYQTEEAKQEDYAQQRPNYRQLYDVYQTPILYLLDKDKRILAKKLTFDQIDLVMEMKKKNELK